MRRALAALALLLFAAPALRHHRPGAAGDRLGGAADRHDRRRARRSVHRHGAGARSGADRRALRRRGRKRYRVPDFQNGDSRSRCSSIAPPPALQHAQAMPPAAPPPTSRCSSSQPAARHRGAGRARRRAPRRRRRDADHRRLRHHRRPQRRGLGVPRMAHAHRHRQARLAADPPGRRRQRATQRAGLGGCTGDSGAPAYDGVGPLVIGVVSWSTGRRQRRRLRRPHRRHAAHRLSRHGSSTPRANSAASSSPRRHRLHFPLRL